MPEPAKLSELNFQVISVKQEGNLPDLSIVMLSGKDKEGNVQLWVDDYSTYHTDHGHDGVRTALKSMTGRVTPFYEAPEFIRDEWVEEGSRWAGRGSVALLSADLNKPAE